MNLATITNDMAAGILGFIGIFPIFGLIITVFSIIITWKLFTKAGEEGWKSIIPIYNTYIMIKIAFGEGKGWMLAPIIATPFIMAFTGEGTMIFNLLYLLSMGFSLYISFNFYSRFASTGMAIGAIFIPIIFAAIIAFGDYSYTPLVQDYNTRNKGDNNPYEY